MTGDASAARLIAARITFRFVFIATSLFFVIFDASVHNGAFWLTEPFSHLGGNIAKSMTEPSGHTVVTTTATAGRAATGPTSLARRRTRRGACPSVPRRNHGIDLRAELEVQREPADLRVQKRTP
jgi:hypothetical protein